MSSLPLREGVFFQARSWRVCRVADLSWSREGMEAEGERRRRMCSCVRVGLGGQEENVRML